MQPETGNSDVDVSKNSKNNEAKATGGRKRRTTGTVARTTKTAARIRASGSSEIAAAAEAGDEDVPVAATAVAESSAGQVHQAATAAAAAVPTVVQPQESAAAGEAAGEAAVRSTTVCASIDQQVLFRVLERAATAVDRSGRTSPILKKLMVQASAETQTITVIGYNQKVGLCCQVDAEVSQSGEFLVSAELTALVGRMPDVKLHLDSSKEAGWLKVSYIGAEHREPIQGTDDYPELPELEGVVDEAAVQESASSDAYVISGIELSRALRGVAFAVDADEDKVTHGVLIQLWRSRENTDGVCVIGCNRGNAAIYTVIDKEHDPHYPDASLLLPVQAVPAIERTFGMSSNVRCLCDGSGRIASFEAELPQPNDSIAQVRAVVRLKSGIENYPNIRSVVIAADSEAVSAVATVDYQRLVAVLSRQEAIKAEFVEVKIGFDGLVLKTCALDKRSQFTEDVGGDTKRVAQIIVPLGRLAGATRNIESEQVVLFMDSNINATATADEYERRLSVEFSNTPLTVMMTRAEIGVKQPGKSSKGKKGRAK